MIMIEALLEFKLAIINKRPKKEVTERFNEYSRLYDEKAGERSVIDKSEYRDLRHDYVRYISASGERN